MQFAVTMPQLLCHGCIAEKSKLYYSGVNTVFKDTGEFYKDVCVGCYVHLEYLPSS
jgi:hypothetical protein